MAVLAVGSPLPSEGEAMTFQQALNVPRLQNWDGAHDLRDLDGVGTDELCLEAGFPILEQQRHNLVEIVKQLVDRSALGMGPRPARDVTDEQASVGVAFDDGGECAHSICGPAGDF
jgi:hypothetical protein